VVAKVAIGSPLCWQIANWYSIAAYSFFWGARRRISADVIGFQAWLEILTVLDCFLFIAMRRWSALGHSSRELPHGALRRILSVAGYLAYSPLPRSYRSDVSALRESSFIFGTVIGAIVP